MSLTVNLTFVEVFISIVRRVVVRLTCESGIKGYLGEV